MLRLFLLSYFFSIILFACGNPPAKQGNPVKEAEIAIKLDTVRIDSTNIMFLVPKGLVRQPRETSEKTVSELNYLNSDSLKFAITPVAVYYNDSMSISLTITLIKIRTDKKNPKADLSFSNYIELLREKLKLDTPLTENTNRDSLKSITFFRNKGKTFVATTVIDYKRSFFYRIDYSIPMRHKISYEEQISSSLNSFWVN